MSDLIGGSWRRVGRTGEMERFALHSSERTSSGRSTAIVWIASAVATLNDWKRRLGAISAAGLLLVLLAGIRLAHASTPFSGVIDHDTRWTVADSPYVLSGQVKIMAGAMLVIEPGVVVQMNVDAGLEVVSGSLSAQGTASTPITITSVNDVPGAGGVPARGDWGTLAFGDGTLAASTVLAYVDVRYGHGITISSASPVFHYLNVDHHVGAAITINLDSSPKGDHLEASDNDINGILVPAGEIGTDVTWAMTGIPYVVNEGTVAVGKRTFGLLPRYSTVRQGGKTFLELNLPDAAPSAGLAVALASSPPSVATVQPSVIVAAGAQTASVEVSASTLGTATITATEAGYGSTNATVRVVQSASLTLSPQNRLVGPNQSFTMTLSASEVAPAGGTTVNLSANGSTLISIPDHATIPAGRTVTTFTVNGIALGATTITASAPGYVNATAMVMVDIIDIRFSPSGSISIPKRLSRTIQASLSAPAPAGGVTISLSTDDSAIATVSPSTVTIPPGQFTATQMISAVAVAEGDTVLIGQAPGLTSASIPIHVTQQAAIEFQEYYHSNEIGPLTVGKGLMVNSNYGAIVKIVSGSASYTPDTPVTVSLTSSDSAKVTVPTTVTIPAGNSYAYLKVSGTNLTSEASPVTISATAPAGYTSPAQSLSVKVVAPTLNISQLDDVRTMTSNRDNFFAYWSVPNSYASQLAISDQALTLSIPNPSPEGIVPGFHDAQTEGNVVTHLTILAGQNSSRYYLWNGYLYCCADTYVDQPTSTGTYQIQADLPGIGSWLSKLQTVSTATLQFFDSHSGTQSGPLMVGKGLTSEHQLELQLYANGKPFTTNTPITIDLTSSDTAKAAVPATVTIPAWNDHVDVSVSGIDLAPSGSPIEITAHAPSGYTSPVQPALVNVISPTLKFQSLDGIRSATSGRDDFYVHWSVPNSDDNQFVTETQTLTLSVANASPAGIVPGFHDAETNGNIVTQITIPGGQRDSGYTYVDQPDQVVSTGTYQIQANLSGVGSWQSAVQTVTAATLQFHDIYSQSGPLVVGKGLTSVSRIELRLYAYGHSFTTDVPITINLSSDEPAKVAVPATITIPAYSSSVSVPVSGVDFTSVDSPVAITATPPSGYALSAQPLLVEVIAPTLNFGGLDGTRSISSVRDDFEVFWSVPNSPGIHVATSSQVLALSAIDTDSNELIPGFHDAATGGNAITQLMIPSGYNSSGYQAYVDLPTSTGTYRVQADLTGIGSWQSNLQTVVSPEMWLYESFNNNQTGPLVVGRNLTNTNGFRIELIANGLPYSSNTPIIVGLTSSDPAKVAVPETIVIPAGYDGVNVPVSGISSTAVDLPVQVTVNALSNIASPAQPMLVHVVTPTLNFGLLDGVRGMPSERDDFYVYWSVPNSNSSSVATSEQRLALSVANATPIGIISGFYSGATGGNAINQLTIPAGSNASTYAYVDRPNSTGTYQIQIDLAGTGSWLSDVQMVEMPKISFRTLGGDSAGPLIIGKGLTANYGLELSLSVGAEDSPYITNVPITVSLTSGDSAKAKVPQTVTIPEGQSYAYVPISGIEPTPDGSPVSINAIAPSGYVFSEQSVSANVVVPTLHFVNLDGARSVLHERDDFYVYWSVSDQDYNQVATFAQNLALSIADVNPEGIVSGFHDSGIGGGVVTQLTIPAGESSSLYDLDGSCCHYTYVDQPTGTGSYRIQADLAGVGSWQSDEQTVVTPTLSLVTPGDDVRTGPLMIGKGLTINGGLQLQRTKAISAPVVVNLRSSDSSKVRVPETVIIPAWSDAVDVPISGVDLTSANAPVTITIVPPQDYVVADPLSINVVTPTLDFKELDGIRAVMGARDNFYVSWSVAGSNLLQVATAPQTLTLSITNESQGDLVLGFHDWIVGGAVITSITIPAGQNSSAYDSVGDCCYHAYVDQPSSVGSYQIRAALAGVGEWQSAIQTVELPTPQFFEYYNGNQTGPLVVGKGLTVNSFYGAQLRLALGDSLYTTEVPVTIGLSSSDGEKVAVPATVTIPAGQSYVYLPVSGIDLTAADPPITISVVSPVYSSVPPLFVSVIAPQLGFNLAGGRTMSGGREGFDVYWDVPGSYATQLATAEQTLALSIVNENPGEIVDGFHDAPMGGNAVTQLTISAGQNGSASLSTGDCCYLTYIDEPTSNGTYQVQADLTGIGSWQSDIQTVGDPTLRFYESHNDNETGPLAVGLGLTSDDYAVLIYANVNGYSVALDSPVTISLSCVDATVCDVVPHTLTIPAGESYAYFQVQGLALGSTQVIASATGISVEENLDVKVVTAALNFDDGLPSSLDIGQSSFFSVSVSVPDGDGSPTATNDIIVNLVSENPGVATVETPVTISAGESYSQTTQVTGVERGTTTITARAESFAPVTSPSIVVPCAAGTTCGTW